MSATDRIKVTAETHTMNVFSGHIPDELTGEELLTRTRIRKAAYQRYRITRTLIGNGTVEVPIDNAEIEMPTDEYQLFDLLQPGLPESTRGIPYTFIWLIPEAREPFFPEPGKYYVVFRFYPRETGVILKLSYDVTVT
jgi:hypothetical protein